MEDTKQSQSVFVVLYLLYSNHVITRIQLKKMLDALQKKEVPVELVKFLVEESRK